MAIPRNGFLVHVNNSKPVFVLSEVDARTYPGRVAVQPITVVAGENAADARKALRIAAREKLTIEERAALGLSEVEVI